MDPFPRRLGKLCVNVDTMVMQEPMKTSFILLPTTSLSRALAPRWAL